MASIPSFHPQLRNAGNLLPSRAVFDKHSLADRTRGSEENRREDVNKICFLRL
jgi:hypothetical protein